MSSDQTGLNLLDNDTPRALTLATGEGAVFLARSEIERGVFLLAMDGHERRAEMALTRADLLVIIAHAAKLLAEDEVRS
ncbi:hypothetical protein O7614_26830 [Micromonospora sp. WMMD961]|uniref:hypothetical protein n=1 Tax=Micromonospora sp. WMMD961 TaxID=3016100 RepID=UPI00241679DE|nr:hypothetical protein [Micromonospora sp. WMMD961]MDG4783279.1 hypothetical protein [Micromonospora sp. WMMD961]